MKGVLYHSLPGQQEQAIKDNIKQTALATQRFLGLQFKLKLCIVS